MRNQSSIFYLYVCIFSATTKTLAGMLIGRFLVGAGMGLGPPVASLYVTEVQKLLYLF